MKGKIYFLFLIVIYSCNSNPPVAENKSTDSIVDQKPVVDSAYSFIEAFKGRMKCTDCPGVETEITFINHTLTYKETRNFIGKNKIDTVNGIYTTDRGYKNDEDATVYVLDYDKKEHERRYLKLDDNTIIILDKNDNVSDTTSYAKLYRTR